MIFLIEFDRYQVITVKKFHNITANHGAMKNLIAILILLISLPAFGQVLVGNVDINTLERVKICEMTVGKRSFSQVVEVSIDYGQQAGTGKELKDTKTKKVRQFNSVVDAMNFMESNGWSYVNSVVFPPDKDFPVLKYYFKRKESVR